MVQTKAGIINKKVWDDAEKEGILPYLTSFQVPKVRTLGTTVFSTAAADDGHADKFNFLLDYEFGSIHMFTPIREEVHEEQPEENDLMGCLFRRFFVTIVKECVNTLGILSNLYRRTAGDIAENMLRYESIDERFGQVTGKNYDEYRINLELTDLHKIQKDVNGIINFLNESARELAERGTYCTVLKHIENTFNMRSEERNFLIEVKENERLLQNLRASYKKSKKTNAETAKEKDESIQEMKQTLENEFEYKKQERSYLERWERARKEQNEIIIHNKERSYLDIIESTDQRIELENRCHNEIHSFIEETRKDYMDEIQHWMDTYEREIEERELAIYNLKVDIERITETHIQMQETYEKQQKEMEDWLEYKRLKKEKEERDALELWAAVKIQAWWRGTMYRKKLGPYRKKKKGKKGKGKDKNKKKGKAKKGKK